MLCVTSARRPHGQSVTPLSPLGPAAQMSVLVYVSHWDCSGLFFLLFCYYDPVESYIDVPHMWMKGGETKRTKKKRKKKIVIGSHADGVCHPAQTH